MRKIYIAHPLRGADREKNVAEVTKICKKVVELFPDVLPVSPIHAFSFLDNCGAEGEKKALELCLEMMKSCDAAWFFGAWGKSEGCMEEERTFEGPMSFFSPEACAKAEEHSGYYDRMGTRPLIEWLNAEVYAEPEPLKPCPFCGGAAKAQEYGEYGADENEGEVYCTSDDCPAYVGVSWGENSTCHTRAEAVAAWNRRAE